MAVSIWIQGADKPMRTAFGAAIRTLGGELLAKGIDDDATNADVVIEIDPAAAPATGLGRDGAVRVAVLTRDGYRAAVYWMRHGGDAVLRWPPPDGLEALLAPIFAAAEV